MTAQEQPQIMTTESSKRFLNGELTWAQVTGISMEQAYAMAELGFNLFNQGKLVEAQKIFEGLVALNPHDGYFHGTLGAILARQGKMEEAMASLSIATGLHPLDPQVFVNRAEIYLTRGHFEQALADLRQAIAIDPKGASPAISRARSMAEATLSLIDNILQKKV